MFCLDCVKLGAKSAEPRSSDPQEVLMALRALGERGDVAARRLFFGVIWDEGRSILCYRCKHGRPVRLTAAQREALERGAEDRPTAQSTPATAVGEKATEPLPSHNVPDERRAA